MQRSITSRNNHSSGKSETVDTWHRNDNSANMFYFNRKYTSDRASCIRRLDRDTHARRQYHHGKWYQYHYRKFACSYLFLHSNQLLRMCIFIITGCYNKCSASYSTCSHYWHNNRSDLHSRHWKCSAHRPANRKLDTQALSRTRYNNRKYIISNCYRTSGRNL